MISFGIDIGGTFIKILAVNEKGKVLKNEKFKTPLKFSGQKFIKFLADIVNAWKKELKIKQGVIGLGIAGNTDHKNGILRSAPNIPWRNLEIAKGLKKLTGFNTYASNDANVAAFGVYKMDLKGKYKNMLVLTLGTGVGGGIIIDGKLYQGATGAAGEFGHIKIGDIKTGNLCGCGARGCLEGYACTSNLKKLTLKAAKENPKSKIAALLNKEEFSPKLLSEAAKGKDKFALSIWQKYGTWLGLAIANFVVLFNPQAIVLSGGIAAAKDYFMPSLKTFLKQQTMKALFKDLKILFSKTKNIGALGAALYALSVENEK